MKGLIRLFALGMQDADRRIAAALEPRPLEAADRYLKDSLAVRAIDRVTRRLGEWWSTSETGRTWSSAVEGFALAPGPVRYQAVGGVLITAVAVHVVLTLVNGPRPGWFWMLIPAMVAVLAVLLLAGARSTQTTD